LKIVPCQDLGDLGPKEGSAVVYNWKWYHSAPRLALWVPLILAIVLLKANRNPRVLLLLLPLLIVHLLWLGFTKLLPLPSSPRCVFDQVFTCFAAGLTMLWLLAYQVGNRNHFVTFLSALVIMLMISLLGAVSYSTGWSEEATAILVLLSMLAMALLLGFALAGWRCRKQCSPVHFMLWLAVCTLAVGAGGTLVFALIMGLIIGDLPPLLAVLIVGLVCGLCVYAIELPYMILAFYSSFFRERFYACLRLKNKNIEKGPENM
jgi:MFS family permease